MHTMAKAQLILGRWITSKHPTKQGTSLRPQPHKTRGGRRRRRRRASIAFGLRCHDAWTLEPNPGLKEGAARARARARISQPSSW